MFKTSVGLKNFDNRSAFEYQFKVCCDAGFETFDLDLSQPAVRAVFHNPSLCSRYIDESVELFESCHIDIYQGHAPYHPYVYNDLEKTRQNMEDIRLSIPIAGKLGIKYFIIHPIFAEVWDPLYMKPDVLLKQNIEMYREFVDIAKENGVIICTENLFSKDKDNKAHPGFSSSASDLLEIMNAVPDLCVCLDSGHAVLAGQDCVDMIHSFGDRLKTLHLHGNNRITDLHVSPFEFSPIAWDSFAKALYEIGYDGSVNLEVGRFHQQMPEPLMPDAFRYLHACAAYIASMIK